MVEAPQRDETEEKKIVFGRVWTDSASDPHGGVEWTTRDARITNGAGETVFEQCGVKVPEGWSQLATNVVVSKYFRGALGSEQREKSVGDLINRVTDTITQWGIEDGYFAREADSAAFRDELVHMLLNQYASFNSPVWFNLGVEEDPQCSACFINSVEDNLESILELVQTEGNLFRYGSGSGVNISKVRGSKEPIKGGGVASGPMSFMKGLDAFAGAIKSGGKTRRAAKMVMLDIDHPDIQDFIHSKSAEEEKAVALIGQGYDGSFEGEAYQSVFFQNANHSVRIPDEFMEKVRAREEWKTINRVDGSVASAVDSHTLLAEIASAAWRTGDPGVQFHSTINTWNTCKVSGEITGSNPCSEYMFLTDSACNLASVNLMKFRSEETKFDVAGFRQAVKILITAQDIIIDRAGYPTEKVRENSIRYRPLGLGYANLGALLMSHGLPYDSDEGRQLAAAVTSLLSGIAYQQSSRLAKAKGAYSAWELNEESHSAVVEMHREAARAISVDDVGQALHDEAVGVWDEAVDWGEQWGYRNAQVTVLAPTGTIGFMMDCDTTGIEPELALVKYKELVGGGTLTLVNKGVAQALTCLGYEEDTVRLIEDHVLETGCIENTRELDEKHLAVFDCALRPSRGRRSIAPLGHIEMMAAVQPFLSGAISKTVNLPSETTPVEIAEIYMKSWELGLKAVAVYRDGCKSIQPLTTERNEKTAVPVVEEPVPKRRRLPSERSAITHKFSIGGHEGYITAGLYEDGVPGEIFITMSKEGSTISGLMDSFATSVSLALQYGVPLEVLTNKFSHTRYEPSGFTGNRELPIAKSITDYIFRWLALKFTSLREIEDTSLIESRMTSVPTSIKESEKHIFATQADSPSCSDCGSIMVRSGACYKCGNCGSTSGCS